MVDRKGGHFASGRAQHTHKHMHMGLGDMRGTTEPIRSTRCHLILDRVWLLVVSQSASIGKSQNFV